MSLFRILLAAALLWGAGCGNKQEPAAVPPAEKPGLQRFPFGGDFALTGPQGAPFRLADQRDKIVLLFFGYTSCPDACPLLIADLQRIEAELPKTPTNKIQKTGLRAEGVTAETFDREAAGLSVRRQKLSTA